MKLLRGVRDPGSWLGSSGGLLPIVQSLVLAALALLLVLKAAGSTRWRMEHDTPLLHYAAFLIDERGMSPYRDVFETSMPGTFLFHTAVGGLFGYGDAAFRAVDLFLLACISCSSFFFMRRFGALAGWAAAILFPLVYLGKGNVMSLQRDYLGVVPLALALCCIPAEAGGHGLAGKGPVRLRRFAAVGALFGFASLIKPHLALGLPIFFGALSVIRWRGRPSAPSVDPPRRSAGSFPRSWRDLLRCAGATVLAFLATWLLALAWLWARSSLGAFLDIVFGYLPLHNEINGARAVLAESERLPYLFIRTLGLGGYGSLALLGFFGCYHAFVHARRRWNVSAVLVLLCAAAYLFYPTLAGKFWKYHYMPMVYFLALAGALSLASRRGRLVRMGWLATAIFLLAIQQQLNLPRYVRSTRAALAESYRPPAPKKGRVDQIADWLRHRLEPGDTVQPLDWAAGGAVHAMLLARAKPATRYLYDYHFYHHVSHPYVRNLRRSFLADLKAARPRFIIESQVVRPRVRGRDTARSFFALETFLQNHYTQVRRGDGYSIFERKGMSGRASDPSQKAPTSATHLLARGHADCSCQSFRLAHAAEIPQKE